MNGARTEHLLASLLARGVWLACALIALGLVLPRGRLVIEAGVGLIIALPILRVGLMAVMFARARDHRFTAIAALVLAIIALAAVLGARD